MKLEDQKLLLEFIGFNKSLKPYDTSLKDINAYFILHRRDYDYEILINKKGIDARCNNPWRPETNWHDLFMIIDKICELLKASYADFFDTIPKTNKIQDVYEECVIWATDHLTRIERMKIEREKAC